MTTLKRQDTGEVIELPFDLYPVDDLNWSPVAASAVYTLSGAYDVQQSAKLAGKPLTLQSDASQGLGLVTRDIVNRLHAQAAVPEAVFEMAYDADGKQKKVSVIFDHTTTAIEARPATAFNSPNLDDYFAVTLKFKTV